MNAATFPGIFNRSFKDLSDGQSELEVLSWEFSVRDSNWELCWTTSASRAEFNLVNCSLRRYFAFFGPWAPACPRVTYQLASPYERMCEGRQFSIVKRILLPSIEKVYFLFSCSVWALLVLFDAPSKSFTIASKIERCVTQLVWLNRKFRPWSKKIFFCLKNAMFIGYSAQSRGLNDG